MTHLINNFYWVELPKGTTQLHIDNVLLPGKILYKSTGEEPAYDWIYEIISIGLNSIICTRDEITEEVAKEIVEGYPEGYAEGNEDDPMYDVISYFWVYKDYLHNEDIFSTATESLNSLLTARGCKGNGVIIEKQ